MEVPGGRKTATQRENTMQLVCNLNALAESDRARLANLAGEVLKATQRMRPFARGYSCHLRSGADVLQILAEWIPLEQVCCPFLRFQVTVEAGQDIVLKLTGPEGTTEFLRQEIGSAISRPPSAFSSEPIVLEAKEASRSSELF